MAIKVHKKNHNNKKSTYVCSSRKKYPNCETLFRLIGKVFSNNVVKVITIFFFLVFISVFFSIDYLNADVKKSEYTCMYMLFINFVYSGTIIAYLFSSKTYNTRINNTIYAFDNQNYKDICSIYYRWVMLNRSVYDRPTKYDQKHQSIKNIHQMQKIRSKNKRKLNAAKTADYKEVIQKQNEERIEKFKRKTAKRRNKKIQKPKEFKSRILLNLCRFLFITMWGLCFALLIYYTITQSKVIRTYSCIPFYFVFTLSMFLIVYSFYHCILYICFLHKVSCNNNRRELRKYDFNIYQPSETEGFKQLLSDVNLNSLIFLSIALAYISAFFCLLRLRLYRNIVSVLDNHILFLLFILYGVFCIFSSILVYLVPKLMLRRILSNWTNVSRAILSEELNRYLAMRDNAIFMSYNYLEAEKMIEITQGRLAGLKNEVAVFRNDSINIIIAITTLLAPLLSVLLTYFLGN